PIRRMSRSVLRSANREIHPAEPTGWGGGGVPRPAESFHEKAGVSQVCFLLPPVSFLSSSRAASVAILPSALFVERFSLGASWASSIQQVLLPDYRPRLPSSDGSWART